MGRVVVKGTEVGLTVEYIAAVCPGTEGHFLRVARRWP